MARRAPSVGEVARRRLTEGGRRAIDGIAVPLVAGSRSHPLLLDRRQPSSAWGIVELSDSSDSNVEAVLRTVRRPLSSMGSDPLLGILGSLAGGSLMAWDGPGRRHDDLASLAPLGATVSCGVS